MKANGKNGVSRVPGWTVLLSAVLPGAVAISAASAQVGPVTLSLEDALRRAEDASEQVAIARAGVLRSRGQQRQARSEYFPQVFASLGYTRTLDSEFSVFSENGSDSTATSEPCGSFTPNPLLSLNERVDSLEAAVRCQSTANPFGDFSDLPFGRENQWRLDLSVSQTLFSGGRVQAQNRLAGSGRRVAELGLASARAQLMLDVAQAYLDAALADRLFQIAEATLDQADSTLSQVRLARQVGNQPEFELLRAQVTRDTQVPLVISRRADRDVAQLRLKQLLNLPPGADLNLTTVLDSADATSVVRLAAEITGVEPDSAASARAAVRQAAESVAMQEAQRAIARAERLPSLSLSMAYGRVGYPTNASPFDTPFRTNWTVGATVQVPLFTGGRLSGGAMVARADLEEANARLEMTRELAALDARDAMERLAAAEAAWDASAGTAAQADRAYAIAQVRYTEGISTQLELNDARLVLQQAQANRAQASRDLQVARLRWALLPLLPLGGASGTQSTAMPVTVTQPQQQVTTPSQGTTRQTSASQSGIRAQASQVRNN
jgi:outer membrane protein TolC